MNENFKYIAAAVAVVGLSIGAVLYISARKDRAAPPPKPVAAAPAQPVATEEPAIKHPLPAPELAQPLPPLDESDEPVRNTLEGLVGKESFEQFFVTKDLVRHVVVSIDNLSTEKVAERIRALKPTPGRFAVGGSEEAPVGDPGNFQRYEPLVQLFNWRDTQQLIETYLRHYPLFQEAYESLGHPPQYFNDRLIEVIDHLLATPELEGPIALAQPGVLYEFADPKLESRSAGQKALLRMGSGNAAVVKQKLRELRSQLVAQQTEN